jgi:hypothetical protein
MKCKKTLSEAAKQRIRTAHASGKYKHREGRLEPPYMAPSADPDDYSKVCVPRLWTIIQLIVQSGAPSVMTSAPTLSFALHAESLCASKRRKRNPGVFSGTSPSTVLASFTDASIVHGPRRNRPWYVFAWLLNLPS